MPGNKPAPPTRSNVAGSSRSSPKPPGIIINSSNNDRPRSLRLLPVPFPSPVSTASALIPHPPYSDLLRRLNPKHTTANLSSLITLVPDLTEDLLASVDQPLLVARCHASGRDYLLCDYNRDGDSYRSPWSNEYEPALSDGTVPSEKVRKMEVAANEAFDVYRELYYEGGVSSVYFWNLDEGFAGVVLLKKCVELLEAMSEANAD